MTRHAGDDHPDPVLDWALTERLGGAAPPDLAAGVHQRLATAATQGRPFALAGARSSRQQWLAAAMVLLGTLVVVGVALWRQSSRTDGGDAGKGPAAELQEAEPTPVRVRTVAEVLALPVDTRAVEVIDAGNEVVSALLGKQQIEVLLLAGCERITDAGIDSIAHLRSLRRLDLRRMRGLTAASVLALTPIASLRELDLRQLGWATAEVVARLRRNMPQLVRLLSDVSDQDVEVALAERGLATVHGVEGLRGLPATTVELQLRNGGDQGLAELQRLTNLTVLELVYRSENHFRSGLHRNRADGAPTVEGFSVLRSFSHLRELRLVNQPDASADLFDAVRAIAALRVLQLSNMELSDAALARLGGMPLQLLSLHYCRGLDVGGMRTIAGLSALRSLRIHTADGLPGEGLRALAALPQLEDLDLAGLGGRQSSARVNEFTIERPGDGWGFTEAEARAIATIGTLRRLSLRGLAIAADAVVEILEPLPNLIELDLSGSRLTAAGLEHMPKTVRRLRLVSCSVLSQPLGGALSKGAPELAELDLSDSKDLSDVALQSLRAVASLRRLDLSGCHSVSVDAIVGLEQLEELVVRDLPQLDTQAMQRLREMPRLQWLVTERNREQLR